MSHTMRSRIDWQGPTANGITDFNIIMFELNLIELKVTAPFLKIKSNFQHSVRYKEIVFLVKRGSWLGYFCYN